MLYIDHETVNAFYEAALKAGGKDNGKPGFRPDYHEKYYAAFVYDPLGCVEQRVPTLA